MEPPVSVPSATNARSAATATADPPDDPPATHSKSHGFLVGPKQECSVDAPHANSSKLVFPNITIPAALSRATDVASYGGTNVFNPGEAHVVLIPRVLNKSLIANGTPSKIPNSPP